MASDTENSLVGKIVKLIIVCLVVGYVVHFFEITPEKVLENFGETVAAIFGMFQDFISWASKYIVTGALVVLPIAAVIYGLKYVNRLISNKKD